MISVPVISCQFQVWASGRIHVWSAATQCLHLYCAHEGGRTLRKDVSKRLLSAFYKHQGLGTRQSIADPPGCSSKDGRSLQFASSELQNNRDVVMIAVSEDGRALEFASEGLQHDYEVVMKAEQRSLRK